MCFETTLVNELCRWTESKVWASTSTSDPEVVNWPLLSRTEKLAFPTASGARLKMKRCPPSGSSGSVALTICILCNEGNANVRCYSDPFLNPKSVQNITTALNCNNACEINVIWPGKYKESLHGCVPALHTRGSLVSFQDGVIKTKAHVQEPIQDFPNKGKVGVLIGHLLTQFRRTKLYFYHFKINCCTELYSNVFYGLPCCFSQLFFLEEIRLT